MKPDSNSLPTSPTSFIGRMEEVDEIGTLLTDSDCRLLTLIGPGGIGKTRLAVQAASQCQVDFTAGVRFVSLQPASTFEHCISAIADTLGVSLSGQTDPISQVCSYLRTKELLLLLDNFEQLLSEDGARVVMQILDAAPAVTLLVTSREALNLAEEWRYPVGGMPVPTDDTDADIDAFSAVQLFVERARRVRPDFSVEQERDGVVRICRLVDGMPLALELAASWTRILECTAIADEIQRNIEFLATDLRNVPARHRSMRAVFQQSWELLTGDEQSVFKKLSVFRGAFTREAAAAVADASLSTLSALVDKSLLQWDRDTRYQIHELIRQRAEEHLRDSPDEADRTRELYCAYYAGYLESRALESRADEFIGARQSEIIKDITIELENIRAAWQYAFANEDIAFIKKAAYTFYLFCDLQGRYQEVVDTLARAVTMLDSVPSSSKRDGARVLAMLGFSRIRIGEFERARADFERSRAIYTEEGISPPAGFGTDPLCGLGLLATTLGDYEKALRLGEEARRQLEARRDRLNLQVALYVLADAAFSLGNYHEARQYAERAHTLTEATGNRWMRGYVLSVLGHVARALGKYEQARQHYEAGHTMKQEFDDPEGIAAALTHLAKIARLQEEYTQARQLYRQSRDIYRDINDRGGLAAALAGLGAVASTLGRYREAGEHFHEALQITTEIRFVPLTLSILLDVGALLVDIGRQERGIEVLALVKDHTAGEHETKERAQDLLTRYESDVPATVFAEAMQRGSAGDLNTITIALQTELTSLEESTPPEQPLIEPLTPREHEVLELIADGLTNKEIAEELVLSVGTVKWYTGEIYGKLNVGNRTEAVGHARELDILS